MTQTGTSAVLQALDKPTTSSKSIPILIDLKKPGSIDDYQKSLLRTLIDSYFTEDNTTLGYGNYKINFGSQELVVAINLNIVQMRRNKENSRNRLIRLPIF